MMTMQPKRKPTQPVQSTPHAMALMASMAITGPGAISVE